MSASRDVYDVSRAILGRKDGYVLALEVYMDEAGVHDGSPSVAVAGYIADPDTWAEWTADWQAAIAPIKVFHASECNGFKGEFSGWSREDRDRLVARAMPVMPRHLARGIAAGINLDVFREAASGVPGVIDLFPSPYAACLHWLIGIILDDAKKYGFAGRISFYHEVNSSTVMADNMFEFYKATTQPPISLVGIIYGGKKNFPPLQAADVLAYEAHHILKSAPGAKRRKSWLAMSEDETKAIVFAYDRQNMPDLISRLSSLRDRLLSEGWDGKVEPEVRSSRKRR